MTGVTVVHRYGGFGRGMVVEEIDDIRIKVAFPLDQIPDRYANKSLQQVRILYRSSVVIPQ